MVRRKEKEMKEQGDEELEYIYHDDEVVVLEAFQDAFLGFAERNDFPGAVACYDKSVVFQILTSKYGLDNTEAVDFFEANILGSWLGEATPVFVTVEPINEH